MSPDLTDAYMDAWTAARESLKFGPQRDLFDSCFALAGDGSPLEVLAGYANAGGAVANVVAVGRAIRRVPDRTPAAVEATTTSPDSPAIERS